MSAPPPSPLRAKAAGVIVTYFPDAGFAERLAAIVRETNPVLVVDNSADELIRGALRLACTLHSARLIENPGNRGLAAALNQSFTELESANVEWVIAFDQDSTPEAGFTAAQMETTRETGELLAAVGANWQDEGRPGFPSRHLLPHPLFPWLFSRRAAFQNLRDVTCVITSGTLFHLPTVQKLGGFDERLFLDLVDTDFCLRARAAGYAVKVAAAARLRHRRGAKSPVRFAGRTWWPAFMSESRLHLLFRNRVLLFRRFARAFPHWVVFELAYAGKVLAEIIFLESRKIAKLRACLRGTWEGLRAPNTFRSPPL